MKAICKGTVWSPKYDELRLQSCYIPRCKDLIISEINHILLKNDMDLGLTRDNAPKVSWLLFLGTLNSRNAFFAKSYVPPSKQPLEI
jgi:hypothetical protein